MQKEFNSKIFGKVKVDEEQFIAEIEHIFFNNNAFVYYDFEGTRGKIQHNHLKNTFHEIITQCSLVSTNLHYSTIIDRQDLIINFEIDDAITFYKRIIDTLYSALSNELAIGIIYEKTGEIKWLKQMKRMINNDLYDKKVEFIVNKTIDLRDFFHTTNYHIEVVSLQAKTSIKLLSDFKNKKCDLVPYEQLDIHDGAKVRILT